MDTGNLTLRTNAVVREVVVDPQTGKASGVHFIDSETKKDYTVKAKVVIVAASTLESARLLLLSKSRLYPNGLANSSGHVGHNFCEHVMGPGVAGRAKNLVGKPPTLDDGRPGGFYLPRFRNLAEKNPNFIRGYGFEGGSGSVMFPHGTDSHGFGASFKEEVRKNQGAYIGMGAFGEVLARYENYVDLDPVVKDKWGIPALRFHYKFGDNEHKMAADMKETAQEMFEAAGFEIMHVNNRVSEGCPPRTPAPREVAAIPRLRPQSISTVARRQEPFRRRWQRFRQRQLPESHVDDHVFVLALLRLSRRSVRQRKSVRRRDVQRRPHQSETRSPPMVESFCHGPRRLAPAAIGGEFRSAANGDASAAFHPSRGSRRSQIGRALLHSQSTRACRRAFGNHHSRRQPFRGRESRQGC
jgi:choline dehydrogenase-like flavoprotein